MKLKTWVTAGWMLWSVLVLGPPASQASETRVDAAGGLTTLMTDETNNLDLFLDGNPAGLALLSTRDRVDLTGQWAALYPQPSGAGPLQQSFSTVPRLTDDNDIRYGGLMTFSRDWAFQVSADYLNLQGQSDFQDVPSSSLRYRELIRVAYNAGSFSTGLEITNREIDEAYEPGAFNANAGLLSGASGENKTYVRIGLITTFPEDAAPESPRWQAGGFFETQLGSDVKNISAGLIDPSLNPFSLRRTTSTVNYYYFGPELHYEIPGRLILRFSSLVTNDNVEFQQTVSPNSASILTLSQYQSNQYQSMNNTGFFRLTLPLSDKENLKLGGGLTALLTNMDLLGTGQNVYDTQNKQQIYGALGVGLESPGDYIWAVQFKSQNYVHSDQTVTATPTLTSDDFDSYQLAVGGEKILSPGFALRLGLVSEIDDLSQDDDTLSETLTVGFGVANSGFNLDIKLLGGELFDLDDSSQTSLLLGAEMAGTFFL